MAFDANLLELMPHTISVQAFDSVNQYGEESYSTSVTTYTALVEEHPQIVRDSFGELTLSSHISYTASTSRIPVTSLITLPDGTQPPIIRSDVFSDEDGIHHVVLFFGSGASGSVFGSNVAQGA
jgi:hypothetical protein